jgi:hypothetical protein
VFKRAQPFLDGTREPVLNRIVWISQTHDGKLCAVQPEFLDLPIWLRAHNSSLPPNQSTRRQSTPASIF